MYYSKKPPLFAAMGAIFYALMYKGLGTTLAIKGCQPGTLCVYYWLTVLMVGVPSALMATLFYRATLQRVGAIGWAAVLTALLCFGTVVWPYSLVFNHHLPAAVALFISFYLQFDSHQSYYQNFWAGLLVGLAVMFDLTSVFLALAIFLIVVVYNRRNVLFFISAALIPVLAAVIFNYQITGSILFAYFFREGYNYPGSPWDTTVGGQHPPDNVLSYTFRSLIGDNGLLGYSPLLFFALAGLIQVVSKKHNGFSYEPMWGKSALIFLGIIGHFLFVLTQTNHFGGDAYGWRFFIPVIPTLYFYTIFVVPVRFYKPGGKWIAALWGIAALVSVFSAYQGVRATWHQVNPPFYLTLKPALPFLSAKSNLTLPEADPTNHIERTQTRNFEMPAIPHRLDVNLNNELTLLGYNLPTRRVEPGQSLEIDLFWKLQRVVPGDYVVFTHLVNSNQNRHGSLDRRLQEGYPVAFWYPGEIVKDERQVTVEPDAPPGLAWLRIGAYELIDDRKN